MRRSAFSMVELVFVIVVLGILAAVAVPRFAASKEDAEIAKGRSDIAAIRSAIVTERQSRIITGDTTYINKLHSAADAYFDSNGAGQKLLMYKVTPKNEDGHWQGAACAGDPAECTYKYKVNGTTVTFTYKQSDGTFTCDTTDAGTGTMCSKLID